MEKVIDKNLDLMQLTTLYIHASKLLHSPIDFSINEDMANYMDRLVEAMHVKRLEMFQSFIDKKGT